MATPTFCETHVIPNGSVQIHNTDLTMFQDDELEHGLSYLKSQGIIPKFGDIIEYAEMSGYRNSGKAIFDGEKIVNLDDEPDEYGSLPKLFRVLEINPTGHRFPTTYWHDVLAEHGGNGICHNNYVWFDHRQYRDEMILNVAYRDDFILNMFTVSTWCILPTGERMNLVLNYQNELYEVTSQMWELMKMGYKCCGGSYSKGIHAKFYSHPTLPNKSVVVSGGKELMNLDTFELDYEIIEDIKLKLVEVIQYDELLVLSCLDIGENYPFAKVPGNTLFVEM